MLHRMLDTVFFGSAHEDLRASPGSGAKKARKVNFVLGSCKRSTAIGRKPARSASITIDLKLKT
jgi:hypothetical protein